MVDLYVPTPNYQAPDWSWLAGLPQEFFQGQQRARDQQQYQQAMLDAQRIGGQGVAPSNSNVNAGPSPSPRQLSGSGRTASGDPATIASIRQTAANTGVDPNLLVGIYQGEGAGGYVGDKGSSFGPFQLHMGGLAPGGNAVAGMGDDFKRETGLDPRDPNTVPQQTAWVAQKLKDDPGLIRNFHGYQGPSTSGEAGQQPYQVAGGPIVPQVPMPVDPRTGQRFTDPQEAIQFLQAKAAAASVNPYEKGIASFYSGYADRIAAATAPVRVGPSDTFVDPRTGKVTFQGPYAAGIQRESGLTLDTDANRYRKTGQLPTNIGAAEATRIRERAAELDQQEGLDPADQPQRWQQYKAHQSGIQKFQSGPQGNTVRSFNVLVDHLRTLQQATDALEQIRVGSGDIKIFNRVANTIAEQTGKPAPTNFNATKALVGDEIVKAVVGGGGALGDREEVKKDIDAANSPAQLAGVINQYRRLALGQLRGLEQQYKTATGLDNFNEMLLPETKSFFQNSGAAQQPNQLPNPIEGRGAGDNGKPDKDGWVTLPNGIRYREKK